MRRVGLINFMCLITLAGLIVAFSKYMMNDREEFEQLRLSYAIDYATDAAVAALMDSGELSLDYGEAGKVELDPNVALDTFVNIFAMNYDMNISKENITQIRSNYIPLFAVATFDGYYLAQPKMSGSATDYPENAAVDQDWTLMFGPKMPYKYSSGGSSYALNFGSYVIKMNGNILSKEFSIPPGLTDREGVLREINKVIATDLSYAIDTYNEENYNWTHTLYIPTGLTSITGTNPIKGPGVIAMVQGLDLTTTKPISSFSIGGGKLDSRRTVVGYIRNGIQYYCYSDQYFNIMPLPTALDVFPSAKEAAEANYAADITYLQ